MNRNRDPQSPSSCENAHFGKWVTLLDDLLSKRFTDSPFLTHSFSNGRVHNAGGFFSHAKCSLVKFPSHVFRGLPSHGDLQIVDDTGAGHGHCLDDPFFEELNNNRTEAHLDWMGSHGENGHPVFSMGLHNCSNRFSQFPRGENAGKGSKKILERAALAQWLCKCIDFDLPALVLKGNRLYSGQVNGIHVRL